jgi:ABC-type branched-subunit amino acid transport system substrate-binding protein
MNIRCYQKRLIGLIIAVLFGVGFALSLHAEDTSKDNDEVIKPYGNTPEDLRPYNRFVRKPYKQFFVSPPDNPIEFFGPGRDKPEPDVKTVKIGLLAPLERTHEDYMGRPMLWATQMAIDEANAAGGYKGKPFELIVRNDNGLWGASANEIAAFSYQDKVWAIIGSVDGANTHIAIRVALKTEVPMMNVSDTDPTLMETKIPWVFRNIADDRQMTYTIAYYVYKQLGYRRVAILRTNNRYGRFGVGEFRASSIRLGKPAPIEINYEVHFKNVNPDFTIQMERIEKVRPEAVLLWADAEAAGYIVKEMRKRGLNMPIFASDRVVNPTFLKIAGEAAEGVVATYPYNPDDTDNEKLVAFKQCYKERFGIEPDAYAAHAYDGTNMVIDAIRKAGLNRYRIRDELAKMKRYQGVTGEIMMDDVYSDRSSCAIATVRNGKFVFGEPKIARLF